MKTSVFIPCMFEHWWNIPTILSCYKVADVKPDEVVIYLNGFGHDVEIEKYVAPLKDRITEHPLDVIIMLDPLSRTCSYVRSLSKLLCSGDIIIMQDADDLPICDRVRVIKDIFERENVDVLMHSFLMFQEYMNHPKLVIDNYQMVGNSELTNDQGHFLRPFRLHDGAHAVRREFLSKCNYSKSATVERGRDSEFMLRAMGLGDVRAIDAQLYIYRFSDYHFQLW